MRDKVRIAKLLLLAACVLPIAAASRPVSSNPFDSFPRITLWAWERPEYLVGIDTQQVAVASLDQTIFITDSVTSRPRLQPLRVPPSTTVIAVVRIEAPVSAARLDTPRLASRVADQIVRSTKRPGIAALQIDFDAARSQRDFYTEIIETVRERMPEDMPLSITALASWCAYDRWMSGLPVDEAVPMFFRMGPDKAHHAPGWSHPISESLCTESAGLSTDEPWPSLQGRKRFYIFHPRSWDTKAVNTAVGQVHQ